MDISLDAKLLILAVTLIALYTIYVTIQITPTISAVLAVVILVIAFLFTTGYLEKIFLVSSVGKIIIRTPTGGYAPPGEESGLGIYEDPNMTIPVTVIDWGTITPYSVVSKNKNLYFVNLRDNPIKMNLSAQNWKPEQISRYMWLIWNYNNLPLRKMNVTLITFMLYVNGTIKEIVPSNGILEFSFDIVIMIEEVT
jgi:hypothetical protein